MASKSLLHLDGVAVVTGAGSGLGQDICYALADAGVQALVFADIDEDKAKASAEASKRHARHPRYECLALHVDVTDEASVQNMVDATVHKFGSIQYSINSAGIGNLSGATTANLKMDVFMKTMETNVKGAVLCNRAVSKQMATQEIRQYEGRHATRSLGRGCIVNIGSINSYVAAPGMLSYVASKHALVGVTKVAALDNLKHEVRVNIVCPSWIDTPMYQASLKRVPGLDKIVEAVSPLHRPATVDEVSDFVVFLCSPGATYINGTGMIIDAGATLTAHVA